MRMLAVILPFILAAALSADEVSVLERAVADFASPDALARERASKAAVAEASRLLAPLIGAMEHGDPEVRRRARNAVLALVPGAVQEPPAEIPGWHPMKAAGPPDAVANADHPNAWASKSGNMGIQWLELAYRKALRVHTIRIFEVNSAGAVAEIETIDDRGKRRTVWKGIDPTQKPSVFEVRIDTTGYKVKAVRLVLDTNRRPGWNEIDAVEIVGPDGRAWAVSATASSSWAFRNAAAGQR